MTKTDIIKDAIRRFPHLPTRTLARYVMHNYGPIFDGDLEKIRSMIRYQTGKTGEKNRENAKEIIKHNPSKLPPTWRTKSEPYKLQPGVWLVFGDVHVPFHEPTPIEAMIEYAKSEGIDGFLMNGDIQDCASVSYWPSAQKRNFDAEIEVFIDFLDHMERAFPDVTKIYKPGNHEYRIPRYYQAKAPELIGLPLQAVHDVLGFEYRHIEFLDYHQMVLAGKLPIFHGHEFGRLMTAVNPARGLFLKAKSWAMCGHCHRTSEHPARNVMGKLLTTWSLGCLCDLSPDYNPFGNDWNWGFAIVNVEKDGGFEVVNRRILPNGKVV